MDLSVASRVKSPQSPLRDKLTFFRQSGWMVMATVLSGVFMSAVHMVVPKPMTLLEYSVFFTLLRVFLLMGFPAGGLQVVFAQQAAAAISEVEQRKLAQTTRGVLRATFFLWLCLAAVVFLCRKPILDTWQISNPAALWVTVLLGLASLWAPVFKGILQGRQNFAGLGWVMILDGVGRFTAIVLIVQLGGQAAGGMTGALIGQLLSLGVAAWLVRRVLSGPGAPFAWRPWLKTVVPLTFGVGVFLFMCNADVIYVKTIFAKDESPFYAPAAMIGLALVTFTTPLTAVMFPKVVHSAARTEKTHALSQALLATALLGTAAALACTLFPQLPVRIIYFREPRYWDAAPLVPWFAWSLLPLILANVLISNLLARQRFRVVPWAVAVAVGYAAVLVGLSDRFLLFSAPDVKDSPALISRLQDPAEPFAEVVWTGLPPAARQALITRPVNQAAPVLVEALNKTLQGGALDPAAVSARIRLSPPTQQLLEENPRGKDRVRLNRMLLQDAFPRELASRKEKLFRDLKLVVGTLGVFSSLLLLVAMWFTFRSRRVAGEPAETAASASG